MLVIYQKQKITVMKKTSNIMYSGVQKVVLDSTVSDRQ